jgi:hypothetical protein
VGLATNESLHLVISQNRSKSLINFWFFAAGSQLCLRPAEPTSPELALTLS